MKKVSGVPVIFGLGNTLFLDPPSESLRQHAIMMEEERLDHVTGAEIKLLEKMGNSKLATKITVTPDTLEGSENEVLMARMHAKRYSRMGVNGVDKPRFKKKKAKGANPLSCKKKKKQGNSSSASKQDFIVVLLCHGGEHNQMKVELKDILGERTGEFVSWLWDLLMKSHYQKHTPMSPLYVKSEVCRSDRAGISGVENTSELRILKDLSNQAARDVDMLPVSLNSVEVSKGSQSPPEFYTSTNETNEMEGQARIIKQSIHRNSGPTEDDYSQVFKFRPRNMMARSGIFAGDEPRVPYVTEHKQMHILKRPVNNNRGNVYLQKKERQSRHFQSEKPKYRPPSRTNVVGRRFFRHDDYVSRDKAKPRRSVWDRLGRPSRENRFVTIKDPDVWGNDVKRKRVEDHRNVHLPIRLMHSEPPGTLNENFKREIPAPDNRSGTVLPSTDDDCKYTTSEPELNIMCSSHPADTSIMKRQFSVIGSVSANESASLKEKRYGNLQDTKLREELQRSSSVKYNCSESLNCISSVTKPREELHVSSERFGPPDSASVQGANSVSRRELCGEALKAPHSLVSNCSVTRSEPVNNEVAAMKTDLKPAHPQMLEVKLRLHQNEEEMSEQLKAKQLESIPRRPDLLSNSGINFFIGNSFG